MLDNFPSVQASWVTQAARSGQVSLRFGANDFGSLMIEENVVSAAGAHFRLTEAEIARNIMDAGFVPKRRNRCTTRSWAIPMLVARAGRNCPTRVRPDVARGLGTRLLMAAVASWPRPRRGQTGRSPPPKRNVGRPAVRAAGRGGQGGRPCAEEAIPACAAGLTLPGRLRRTCRPMRAAGAGPAAKDRACPNTGGATGLHASLALAVRARRRLRATPAARVRKDSRSPFTVGEDRPACPAIAAPPRFRRIV